MRNNPKVSILVPVYKVERLIERCAVSLFEQTYDNIEYIFVDDCTPDKSIEVLRDVMKRYPHRASATTILRHDHNRGQAAGRNTLIDAAIGDYVAFVDSDDYVDRQMVEKSLRKMSENDADMMKFDIKVMRKKYSQHFEALPTTDARQLFLSLVARKCYVCVCGGLYKRALFVDNNVHCEEGTDMGEDWMMSVQLAYNAKRVNYLNEDLYFYDCTNENQSTGTFSEKNMAKSNRTYEIIGKYISDKGDDANEAFRYALASFYIVRLKLYALAPDNHAKDYALAYASCKGIEYKYMENIFLWNKVLKYLPSYRVAKAYMTIVKWCGETFRSK